MPFISEQSDDIFNGDLIDWYDVLKIDLNRYQKIIVANSR